MNVELFWAEVKIQMSFLVCVYVFRVPVYNTSSLLTIVFYLFRRRDTTDIRYLPPPLIQVTCIKARVDENTAT